MKKYRSFTEDFKRTIVFRIDSGQITKAAAARENDLAPSLVDRWCRQVHTGALIHHPTKRERQLEKELDQYKKKVGELTMQNEALKKIPEFLASLRKSDGCVVTGLNTAPSKRGAQ
jgi:transposase-like protein